MATAKKSEASRPIGIFDSGIGGLTVANAIHKLLPKESLVYFGDTAHLPYGEKSAEAIRHYSERISDFLLSKRCKLIVIACNSASSVAYDTVKRHAGKRARVVNVIDPVVDVVAANASKVGVIGTKATIKSEVYAKKLRHKNKRIEVASLATPLLAPMIEEGFFNNKISRTIINSYLSRPKIAKINSLILACTHYPLIHPEIDEYYKGRVDIIDSAEIVAKHVKALLEKEKLLHAGKSPRHHFYVSDFTPAFEKSTRIFFRGKIKLEYYPIWEK